MSDDCRKVLQRAYLFVDHELLSATERNEIEAHLEDCSPCFRRYGLEQEVTELVARLRRTHVCPDELKGRITRLLDSI